MNIIAKNKELLIGLAIFWGQFTLTFLLILRLNNGYFVYILDDVYIHMAIAKNFVKYNVWGVTKYEFSSTSSSLLYTLLISFSYLIFGVNQFSPLIINLIAANLLIYTFYVILKKRYKLPSYIVSIGIISMILFIPLINSVFLGLEHTLHILITIIFMYLFVKIVSDNIDNLEGDENKIKKVKRRRWILLMLLSPLITLIRFEGIFLIIICSFILLYRKKYKKSLLLIILGLAPVVLYGLISMYNGWFFFPNSIMIKANFPEFQSFYDYISVLGGTGFDALVYLSSHLLILLISAAFIIYKQSKKKEQFFSESTILAIIFFLTTLLQLQYALASLFSRYDEYLVAIGILMVLIYIKDKIPQKFPSQEITRFITRMINHFKQRDVAFFREFFLMIIVSLFLSPFLYRGFILCVDTPTKSNNIYDQQYQMGLFLNKYYSGEDIAANDIGAINYLADIKCIDLYGLGTYEVGKLKVQDALTTEEIDEITKEADCKIAILYDIWFTKNESLPITWFEAGRWTLPKNKACAYETVTFYALKADQINELIENLKDFSKYLPRNVIQSGNYTE